MSALNLGRVVVSLKRRETDETNETNEIKKARSIQIFKDYTLNFIFFCIFVRGIE